MPKIFSEFKTFITRGNVMDMAVGVIIGGAFSAIVTALTDNILQPLINWLIYACMGDGADNAYTMLVTKYLDDGVVDMDNSIYIDWGAFISAIINFILIAIVLFLIIKALNSLSSSTKKLKEKAKAAEEKHKAEKEAANAAANGETAEPVADAAATEEAPTEAPVEEAPAAEAPVETPAAEEAAPAAEAVPSSANVEQLLAEIRDLLRAQNITNSMNKE